MRVIAAPSVRFSQLAYYTHHAEPRSQQLNARVPKSVLEGLRDLARLWTAHEQARTGDETAEVSLSDVVVRLLKVGLDGAWEEIGHRPTSEEEWAELLARGDKIFSAGGKTKYPKKQ